MQKLSKLMFSPLYLKWIRRRVVFFLKQYFYPELEFEIPIGNDLVAPITFYDSYDSFSEIFLQSEYDFILPHIKTSKLKWLDIGCNNGYFSLWLLRELKKQKKDCRKAVLIDADSKSNYSVPKLIFRNKLNTFTFINKGIGENDSIHFYERPFMASSTTEGDGEFRTIETVSSDELSNDFWDFIKLDIEGSEWDFIVHYKQLLEKCRYLVLEWHSWHNGGGAKKQLLDQLDLMNFKLLKETEEIPAVGREGSVGVVLLEKC